MRRLTLYTCGSEVYQSVERWCEKLAVEPCGSVKMIAVKLLWVATVAFVVLSLAESRPAQDNPEVICKLPAYRGHCRALLPRWMYNASIGKCEEFRFGGCDKNGNNFKSQKACMAVCGGIK